VKETEAKKKEQKIRAEMESCVHFHGIQHELCKAGINIRQLVGGDAFGWARRIPCLNSKICTVHCDSRKLPTREQAETAVAEQDQQFEKTMKAVEVAHAHAKANGLGVGNGGRRALPCPLECGGELRYSVAGVNGHMHARCENGCVSWME